MLLKLCLPQVLYSEIFLLGKMIDRRAIIEVCFFCEYEERETISFSMNSCTRLYWIIIFIYTTGLRKVVKMRDRKFVLSSILFILHPYRHDGRNIIYSTPLSPFHTFIQTQKVIYTQTHARIHTHTLNTHTMYAYTEQLLVSNPHPLTLYTQFYPRAPISTMHL